MERMILSLKKPKSDQESTEETKPSIPQQSDRKTPVSPSSKPVKARTSKADPEPQTNVQPKPVQVKKPKGVQQRKTDPAILKAEAEALIAKLEVDHPDLFPADGTLPKPWKIGLRVDVKKKYEVPHRISRIAIDMWRARHRKAYEAVLVEGASRYGLDGEAVGEVSEEGSLIQIEAMRKQRQIEKEKKKQKQKQQALIEDSLPVIPT